MGRARSSAASLLLPAVSAGRAAAAAGLCRSSSYMAAPAVACRMGSIRFQSIRVTTLLPSPDAMSLSRTASPVAVSKPSTPC